MQTQSVLRRTGFTWLVLAMLILAACAPVDPAATLEGAPATVDGPVQIDSGGEVPFYARFGENETFADGEQTVIVFYRPPDCIPADFNLNQFFHFPDDTGPGAFGCTPPTTTGLETWQNGPDVDPAPLEAEVTGQGAVPVWFAATSEIEEAMADGEVTIAELAALPSLQTGTATSYEEFLRPTQSNDAPLIRFAAEGSLDDGTPFAVDVSYGVADVDDHTVISLGESPAEGEEVAGDMEGTEAPTVTFTATEFAYDGPAEIPGGLTRLELVNAGELEHSLWAIQMADGKGLEDFMGVMAEMESNPDMPDWMAFYGGVTAQPGESAAYTVDLPAGNYLLISISGEEVPDVAQGMAAMLTVTEPVAGDVVPPVADVSTEMVDFSYLIEGTPSAGFQIIEVTNTGMEPHEVVWLTLAEDAGMPEVMEFMMAGEEAEGMPPFMIAGIMGPQSAGVTTWHEWQIEPGEYGLICFVSSPGNEGAPHFMLGMTAQISVN